ncbi:5'-3' exoribonuclease 2 [Thelohanellus kitauei]|uniref:5'-3' exoribonuclease 2 n=1 Tax=Thelohanellus kitauei TaxID=669202 RepID=A0A0C2J3Q6_THEKT|nr:5'-3' exoribonuclease 2 [Thelohanellus kitauei]
MIEDNIFKRRSHRKRSFLERKKSTESLDSWKRDKGPTNEIINDSIKEPQNLSDITDITSKKRRLSERSDLEKEIDDFENDPIKLGQEGWKFRYYQNKFKIEAAELDDYRSRLAKEYLIGVNWVLEYYYQGCASWEWSYPFHYAPFASDFSLVDKIETQWNNQIKDPFLPFEQLMAVLPESSKDLIPNCYHTLMQSHVSFLMMRIHQS